MTTSTAWETSADAWRPPTPSGRAVLDDVIVGAGVVGLSAAIALASRGRTVAVVEAAGAIGHGTTGRSTGKLSLLQGTRLSVIADRHGIEVARRYLDGCRDALTWVEPMLDRHGIATDDATAITWAERPDQDQAVAHEHGAARRAGLPTRWTAEVPGGLPGTSAVVLERQRQVDPLGYAIALAREAVDLGVDFHLDRRIRHIRSIGHRAVVSTGSGFELSADEVVVATGLPITDRSGAFATTHPHRSYIVAFDHDGPVETMAVTAGSPTISVRGARLDGREAVLVGGHGHVVGRGGPTGQHLDALRHWAHEHLDVGREIAAWSAQDQTTPDDLPIVGRAAGDPAIHVATGLGGWGLLAGVAAARRIAGAVTEGETLPVAPPRHLLRPASLMSILGRNAVALSDLVGGWAGAGLRPRATSTVDGCRRSLSGVCTHLGGVVRWNEVERSWDCPLHGSRFAPDGRVIEGPATRPLRPLNDQPEERNPQ